MLVIPPDPVALGRKNSHCVRSSVLRRQAYFCKCMKVNEIFIREMDENQRFCSEWVSVPERFGEKWAVDTEVGNFVVARALR